MTRTVPAQIPAPPSYPSSQTTLDDMIGSTGNGQSVSIDLRRGVQPDLSLPEPRFIITRTSADRFLLAIYSDGLSTPMGDGFSNPMPSSSHQELLVGGPGVPPPPIWHDPFQLSWLGSKAAHKVRARQHYPQMVKIIVCALALVAPMRYPRFHRFAVHYWWLRLLMWWWPMVLQSWITATSGSALNQISKWCGLKYHQHILYHQSHALISAEKDLALEHTHDTPIWFLSKFL